MLCKMQNLQNYFHIKILMMYYAKSIGIYYGVNTKRGETERFHLIRYQFLYLFPKAFALNHIFTFGLLSSVFFILFYTGAIRFYQSIKCLQDAVRERQETKRNECAREIKHLNCNETE